MLRRVLNLVVENTRTGVHSLRRIDPLKHLFYEDALVARAAKANSGKIDRMLGMQALDLPDPVVSFAPSPCCMPLLGGLDLFALLRSNGSEGKIISSNVAGETVMYDVDQRLFLNLPWLNEPKGWNPVCLSIAQPGAVENSLYVMEKRLGDAKSSFSSSEGLTSSCFEVLEYGPRQGGKEVWDMHPGWHWRRLPPPPFVLRPDYKPSYITSYTSKVDNTDGRSTIYISCDGIGTYCFDTSRHLEEWRHVADWLLPLHMEAKYVPKFNLWFGFSADGNKDLCALDLSAMEQDNQKPIVQYRFEDLNPPTEEKWLLMSAELVDLGKGKFCVTRSFDAVETIGQQFAVLTGIEIVRGDDHGLHMVKHKSTCYSFAEDIINWVL